MKFQRYKVVYRPFPNSGGTAEVFINALDELDAKRQFEDFSYPKPPGSSIEAIDPA